MKDKGREYSDEALKRLEKRIRLEYSKAYEDLKKKADRFFKGFEKRDERMRPDETTGKEWEKYVKWRRDTIMQGKQYTELLEQLSADMARADALAVSIIRGDIPAVFAENANWGMFEIESSTTIDIAFSLYDRDTVNRLLKDEPDLIPAPKTDIPKDKKWNKKHIGSAILQGILQGDTMENIAKRLMSVADMDMRAAMRTARTAVNGAENAGRMQSYRRAADMGIKVKKEWLATLDTRTRHSHRMLDGEVVELNEKFSNGLEYPGDPSGSASEVYNCRCTMIANLDDFQAEEVERYSKLDDMTYEEWKNGKKVQ